MFDQWPIFRNIKNRRAQGMAEFALVLPILLVVILGIIAFGHLFFNYTLVVASAREAARFGIATGLTARNVPSFRDCDAIRDAAVRVGSYAGVDPTDVTILYDKGPSDPIVYVEADIDGDGVPEIEDCPIHGVGPGNVEIGDRIVVTVSVNYVPIIPLGFIPEIPLTATTQRTLIRSMPIDDQTVSANNPTCNISTITRVLPPGWDSNNPVESSTSFFGDSLQFSVQVIDDTPQDTNYATGKVFLFVDDSNLTPGNHRCTGDMTGTGNVWLCDPINDLTVGMHTLYAEFKPSAGSCYLGSTAEWGHEVK